MADFPDYRLLHVASYMALFCVGVYAASFGPALPFLADDLGVSLDTAGLLLTALFAGSIAASGTVAVALQGIETRRLAVAGLVCATAGALMLGVAPSWELALAGAAVLGAGDGLIIASLHMLMAMTSRDVPAAMNRLNLWFAAGAVASAVWAGAVLEVNGERATVYGGVAAVLALTLAVMLASSGPAPSRRPNPPSPEGEGAKASVQIGRSGEAGGQARQPGNATAWVMGAVLFLYVGAEFGLGSWVSTYARETTDASVFGAALLSAGYWSALLCGRVAAGWYFSKQRDARVLLTASAGGVGLAAVILAATTGNIALSAGAAFGAGLCLGPVWPSTLAIASAGNPANTAATTVTLGNAGGLFIPWLQGKILVGAGPREGVIVTAALSGMMLALLLGFRRRPFESHAPSGNSPSATGAGEGASSGLPIGSSDSSQNDDSTSKRGGGGSSPSR